MPKYFEFEVSLSDVVPRIWRRFLIREDATFMDLHETIQDACGWSSCHLFVFHTPDEEPIAGIPDDGYADGPDPDAMEIKLSSYFGPGRRTQCFYVYDFGDAWEHEVKLLDVRELPEDFERRFVDGARAFPKEDCGGLPGYKDCVRVATTGKDRDGLLEWLSGWHPEKFDPARLRRDLAEPSYLKMFRPSPRSARKRSR
jgi:hypothetical protein